VLILCQGRWVKLGLRLEALLCLGIVEGVWMLTVAIAPLVTLRKDYPLSLVGLWRSRFHSRSAPVHQEA
jgi:hypothetical protein